MKCCFARPDNHIKGTSPGAVIANTLGVKTKYRNVEINNSNGFRLESYFQSYLAGKLFEAEELNRETLIANLSHPKTARVVVGFNAYGTGDNGIELKQNDTSDTYLFVIDYDGDGIMDHLSYTVLNSSNEPRRIIDDYGMDGQADYKRDLMTGERSIFYDGRWYQIRKGEKNLNIEGRTIPIASVLEGFKRKSKAQ